MAKFQDPLDNPEPFQIPEAILTMLDECSPQGFMFFYCDSHGSPQAKINLPYIITSMGLRSYASKTLDIINETELDAMAGDFIRQNFDSDDDDEGSEN